MNHLQSREGFYLMRVQTQLANNAYLKQTSSLKSTTFSGVASQKTDSFTSNKYLLAFDLDGTFLHNDKNAIDSFKSIVRNKDHKLTFVTSRSIDELSQLKEEYAKKGIDLPTPDYFISNDGQYIYKVNETSNGIEMILDKEWDAKVSQFSMDEAKEVVNDLIEKTKKGNRPSIKFIDFKTTNFNAWYLFDHEFKDTLSKDLTAMLKDKSVAGYVIDDYVEPPYMKKKPNFEDFKPFLDKNGGCYAFCISASNKADAVKHLQQKLNIKTDHVITAGDGGNDISLTESGFFFIIVNNAKEILKDHVQNLSALLKDHILKVKEEGLAGINEGLTKIFSRNKEKK